MVLAVVMCGLLWPAGARADAPANDDFADAQALVTGVAATGDTSEASAEDGEPAHSAANGPNRSVWFTWTPESGGLARISACGSGFDTVVAVYGGSALQGIFFSKLANNDDGCGVGSTSMVHLRVTAGVTYRVVLDGWGSGDAGAYSMVADVLGDPGQPPANDDLDHEFGVTGTHVHATGTNVGATSGWNEWPASGTQLVWWRWASPVSGQVHVDTCASGFDTILGVVRRSEGIWAGGESAGGGCGDGGTRGMVTFNAIEDVEYWIGVGGEAGTTGAIDLRIDAGSDITPPVTTITAGPGATWDRYVARIEWTVQDEAATTSDCRLDEGGWITCAGGETLEGLDEGEHVFQIRSKDQYGNVEDPVAERRFTVRIPAAANDHFADAAALVPGAPVSVNTGKATAEPGEPSHDTWYFGQGLNANFSAWFALTPAADGTAELDWCASGFDAVVAAYTGASVGALQRVGAWDEECRGSFAVRAGVTYHVAVDGLARNRDYGTGPVRIAVAYTQSMPEPAGGAAIVTPPPATTVTTRPGTGAVASLSIAKSGPLTARVDRRGRFSVKGARLSCAAAQTACTARVEVRTRRRGGRRLGGATLTIDPAHERALRARLRRPAREKLARRGRLAVWLRIALGDGAPVAKRVTLLRRNAG